jgi:hypothetical protein
VPLLGRPPAYQDGEIEIRKISPHCANFVEKRGHLLGEYSFYVDGRVEPAYYLKRGTPQGFPPFLPPYVGTYGGRAVL